MAWFVENTNQVALCFEIVGFSLVILESYFPRTSEKIESFLDTFSRGASFRFGLSPDFITYIFSTAITVSCSMYLLRVIESVSIDVSYFTYLEIAVVGLIVLFFGLITLIFSIEYFIKFLIALLIDAPGKLLNFFDSIDPQERILGGAGIVIAFVGLSLDSLQLWMFPDS